MRLEYEQELSVPKFGLTVMAQLMVYLKALGLAVLPASLLVRPPWCCHGIKYDCENAMR